MLCWHRPREVAALQDCFVDADGSCFVYEISVRHCEARGFCMYVCVYVLCMYVYMYFVCLNVCMYVCTVCLYVYLRQHDITRRCVLWRDRTELIVKEIPEFTLSHCLPVWMYVCMYVCMYVLGLPDYVTADVMCLLYVARPVKGSKNMCEITIISQVCEIYVCMYVCMYVYTNVWMYVYICTQKFKCDLCLL